MFGLPEDVYLERMVDILDVDGNRTIDFREFVVRLAAFVLSAGRGAGYIYQPMADTCTSRVHLPTNFLHVYTTRPSTNQCLTRVYTGGHTTCLSALPVVCFVSLTTRHKHAFYLLRVCLILNSSRAIACVEV